MHEAILPLRQMKLLTTAKYNMEVGAARENIRVLSSITDYVDMWT